MTGRRCLKKGVKNLCPRLYVRSTIDCGARAMWHTAAARSPAAAAGCPTLSKRWQCDGQAAIEDTQEAPARRGFMPCTAVNVGAEPSPHLALPPKGRGAPLNQGPPVHHQNMACQDSRACIIPPPPPTAGGTPALYAKRPHIGRGRVRRGGKKHPVSGQVF